jgi:type I restriction enzyme, R subunit
VTCLETSLAQDKPRALIQMATGSGKTFTAINAIYRLVKFGKAKRVLFLVDHARLKKSWLMKSDRIRNSLLSQGRTTRT